MSGSLQPALNIRLDFFFDAVSKMGAVGAGVVFFFLFFFFSKEQFRI